MNLKQSKKLRWLARGLAVGLKEPARDALGVPESVIIVKRDVRRRVLAKNGDTRWATVQRFQLLYHREKSYRGCYKRLKFGKVRLSVATSQIRSDIQGMVREKQELTPAIRHALRHGTFHAV